MGETVGVAGSVPLQQPVGFEVAQVVAELGQPVGGVGEVEGGEDDVVSGDLLIAAIMRKNVLARWKIISRVPMNAMPAEWCNRLNLEPAPR